MNKLKIEHTGEIKYSGEVTVEIVRNNKTLSKKKYHNNGYKKLFNFIGNCLAGTYQTSGVPAQIQLFTKGKNEIPSNPNYSTTMQASTIVRIDTDPAVEWYTDTDTGENITTVSYHFTIPYSFLLNRTEIYKAALFDQNTNQTYPSYLDGGTEAYNRALINRQSSIYAAFEFVDDDGKYENPLEEITKYNTTNYSLIITWVMTLKNQEN